MSKQVISFVVIVLISFVLGFFVSGAISKINTQKTFQDGWDAAKQRLVEMGLAPAAGDIEITSVGGEVGQVKDDRIILEIYPIELLSDPKLDERIVQIGEDTKIYQLKEKDPEQYQKEMEELNPERELDTENPEVLVDPPIFPELFNKVEVSFYDIKKGQSIVVIANENIRNAKEFKAAEIVIQAFDAVNMLPLD